MGLNSHYMMRRWLCFVTFATVHFAFAAGVPKEQRIVFLGDSITQGGAYIEYIEAALIAQHPESNKQIIPLGLSSETVSGLSEDGHAGGKFPRPDLHERLERVLAKTRPEVVLACYGMNDGIYQPLDAQRTAAFQTRMRKLHEKVTSAGARIIHLTPPVFDPVPIAERVLPAGLDAYPRPFKDYNAVLDVYSDWLLAMRQEAKWEVLDVHGRMTAALASRRADDPKFSFAKDGVHPGPEGHLIIAQLVLEAWGLKARPDGTPDHVNGAAILAAVKKKHALLRPAWLSHVGHTRPGNAPGLPLPEAEARSAVFDAEARRLALSRDR